MRRSSGTVSLMRSSPPVTPASAMNEPISMWSGLTACSQPPRRATPWTVRTLEEIPSIAAPMRTSMRARSCTCGSQAALRMIVVPGVSAAAIRAFSVPITDGSSMKKSTACRPVSGASRRMSEIVCSTVAPRAMKASRCGSRRRRPMTSPPGGGMWAEPKRASSGPASRKDARMRSARLGVDLGGADARRRAGARCCPRPSRPGRRGRRAGRTSPACRGCRGTLRRTTSSSVRRAQARSGSAAFLLPAGTSVPDSGTPPSMTNFSMRAGCAGAGANGRGTVTAMSSPLSRDEAWTLLCEWTESDSLRRHMLAVETAMRAYAERFGEDADEWGTVGLLHDADYERFPDLGTGHPREIMAELERRDAPPKWIRAIASHADFMEVSRDSPMERTLFAVDELSGFLTAVRLRAPRGHPRADAEVGQEEAQAAVVRGGGVAGRRPRRRRAAGDRVRRARRLRDRRAGGAGGRARPQRPAGY